MWFLDRAIESFDEDQKRAIVAEARRFYWAMVLSMLNFGGLLYFTDWALTLINKILFQSTPLIMVSYVLAGIFWCRLAHLENTEKFKQFRIKMNKIILSKKRD